MTWERRENRQRSGPVSRGKACDWCPCSTCQDGGKSDSLPFVPEYIEIEDGTYMCDTCWIYPPCGTSDDCDEFKAEGTCEHRPKMKSGATWSSDTSRVPVDA